MKRYQWNAQDYEKHSLAQQKWARELLDKLSLNGTEDVLDIGCGDGKVTAEISKLVSKGTIVGIDNSSSMIALASKRYPPKDYPNLSFQQMDAGNLLFHECFDLIFSNAALHWVKNQKPVIEGFFKGLRQKGKILLQLGGKGNAAEIISVLSGMQTDPEWKSYFEKFDFPYFFPGTDEYESILLKTGFKINRLELIPKDMAHAGKTGLEGWIRTTWLPYTQQVPSEKRDKFVDAVSTKYIERTPVDSKGRLHVQMLRLEVEAEKI